jgi:ferredoxin-NADP reductase
MHILGILRRTTITFVDKVHEKDDVYTFSFTPNKPIKHLAGQHSLVVFPRKLTVRPFSLASSPDDTYIKIGTHVGSGSRFKRALMDLKPGDTLQMFGPYLDFIAPKDDRPMLMLAQGIGITPFRSLLLWLRAHQPQRVTRLIHVENAPHTYSVQTKKSATSAIYPTDPEQFRLAVHSAVKELPDGWVYLSGSPRFIKSTVTLLTEAGIRRSQIKKDGFLGY